METTVQRAAGTGTDSTVLAVKLVVLGVLLGTALYAPREKSERAFRLLDLMKGSPEPAAPAPAPPVRRRTQQ
ncbi:hypothetical protein [Streptomyces sp. NPDC005209]|uniref:hypothetical protein n=1 Tax=Streptomyces sp. NPDC005209 TaxID=3156715 RepID=UPI0033A76F81